MADASSEHGAASAAPAAEREVPVPAFNEVTVDQAVKRLRRLTPAKLRRVRAYEVAHMNRQNVLAAIDGLLAGDPLERGRPFGASHRIR